MKCFTEFKLQGALEKALRAMKFNAPTPIQAKAIPLALAGKDIIATAQTGTGKTAAFGIPTAEYLIANRQACALVLAPTRELAQQIESVWRELTKNVPELRAVCVMGGASFGMQRKGLARNPRMIIATPGRLVDHLQQRTVNLARVEILILDEADRMLDMGFAPQLSQILRFLPKERQTMLFSATWGPELDQLSKKYLRTPERIAVGSTSQAAGTVEQSLMPTTIQQKNETLLDAVNERQGSILVFTRTQIRTDRLAKFLNTYGLEVGLIHGGRTQAQRSSALASFKAGRIRILVATDIAARGIDVVDIAHVINYDLPQVPEDYIHRIGRTGRAGAKGQALSLLTKEERGLWRDIAHLLKKTGSAEPVMLEGKVPAIKIELGGSESSERPQHRHRDQRRENRGGGGGGGGEKRRNQGWGKRPQGRSGGDFKGRPQRSHHQAAGPKHHSAENEPQGSVLGVINI